MARVGKGFLETLTTAGFSDLRSNGSAVHPGI